MPTDIEAYSLNVTVFGSSPSTSYGFVTLYPAGATRPSVSSMNFLNGTQTSNAVAVAGGTSSDVTIYTTTTTHFTLDINGYYTNNHATGNGFTSIATNTYGVFGGSDTSSGVAGVSTSSYGVLGLSGSSTGVYGGSFATTGDAPGVLGISVSTGSRAAGVKGVEQSGEPTYPADATFTIEPTGVLGVSRDRTAVTGITRIGSGTGADFIRLNNVSPYGISTRARLAYSSVDAGVFNGDVHVYGTLSKTAGSFKIDHPVDPENKYLYHSFVESPDMMNVYNGVAVLDANGEAIVQLPAYFEALNVDPRYQLTPISRFPPQTPLYIAQEISNNQFRIAGGAAGMKVSWQVTGIRNDAYARTHRIQVEVPKEPENLGMYLNPVELGKPAGLSITGVTPASPEAIAEEARIRAQARQQQ